MKKLKRVVGWAVLDKNGEFVTIKLFKENAKDCVYYGMGCKIQKVSIQAEK